MEKTTRTCAWCARLFESCHPRAIYCGHACSVKRNNTINNAKRHKTHPKVSCETCGRTFVRPRSDSRHCSPSCRGKAQWRATYVPVAPVDLTCEHCGKNFRSKFKKARMCSDRCRKRAGYDRNADDRRRYTRAWTAANQHTEAYRVASQVKYNNRRAAKVANPGSIGVSVTEWLRILRAHGFRCAYCGIRPERLTQDHVIPLSRGGRHAPANCVPACKSCNYSKGGKLLVEWKRRRRVRI